MEDPRGRLIIPEKKDSHRALNPRLLQHIKNTTMKSLSQQITIPVVILDIHVTDCLSSVGKNLSAIRQGVQATLLEI